MGRKITGEEHAVRYFRTAPYAEAKVVFNVVREIMHGRAPNESEQTAPLRARRGLSTAKAKTPALNENEASTEA